MLIKLPSSFVRLTGESSNTFSVPECLHNKSLHEVLHWLISDKFPSLRKVMLQKNGIEFYRFVRVYVNSSLVKDLNRKDKHIIREDDVIEVIVPIAGG